MFIHLTSPDCSTLWIFFLVDFKAFFTVFQVKLFSFCNTHCSSTHIHLLLKMCQGNLLKKCNVCAHLRHLMKFSFLVMASLEGVQISHMVLSAITWISRQQWSNWEGKGVRAWLDKAAKTPSFTLMKLLSGDSVWGWEAGGGRDLSYNLNL